MQDPGHADGYEHLSITWIRGRRPELRIFDDSGVLTEVIELSPFTTEQLHNILKTKGFRRIAEKPVPAIAQNIFLRQNFV
jgi:hypothetical protein